MSKLYVHKYKVSLKIFFPIHFRYHHIESGLINVKKKLVFSHFCIEICVIVYQCNKWALGNSIIKYLELLGAIITSTQYEKSINKLIIIVLIFHLLKWKKVKISTTNTHVIIQIESGVIRHRLLLNVECWKDLKKRLPMCL